MSNALDQPGGLHVALVAHRYDPAGGGAERWLHEHVLGLLAHGHKVTMVAGRIVGLPSDADQRPVSVRGSLCRHGCWAFAQRVGDVLQELKPDLVVDMGCTPHADIVVPHFGTRAANERARVLMRSPVQRLVRGASRVMFPRSRRLLALEQRVLKGPGVRGVVAVSGMTAQHLVSDTGVNAASITVIPNGVDLHRFTPPDDTARRQARSRLGMDGRTVLLMVAHDFALKGVYQAVRALGRARAGDTPHEPLLVIIGQDPSAPVRRLAERLGVSGRVRIEGPVQDPRAHYSAADLLLHPTWYDPCSLVALEAVACGLPVLTTSRNGAAERLVNPPSAVVLTDPGDEAALWQGVISASRPQASRAMRDACLSTRGSLDARPAFHALLSLYRTVLAVKRADAAREATTASP